MRFVVKELFLGSTDFTEAIFKIPKYQNILNMFVFADSVVFILFLSLPCLERFSATFREILLPSSGKMCDAMQSGIFAQRAMVDQAREGLCYQSRNLMFLICLTWKKIDSWFIFVLISFCNLLMVDLVLGSCVLMYSRLSLRFSLMKFRMA